MGRMEGDPGQSTAEYMGLLALVAAVLVGAGAAVGSAGVPEAVAGVVRSGICIVGGDVCRASDAAALGLEPCTVGELRRGRGAVVTVLSLRIGDEGEWTVGTRSDGSVVVTHARERVGGVAGGFGVTASPLGLKLGVEGAYGFTVGSGRSWELPDAAAAARLLAADDDDRPPPDWRFGDLGTELVAKAGAMASGALLSGLEASGHAAAGARIGRGETTLYVRTRLDEPRIAGLLPGAQPSGPRSLPGTGITVDDARAEPPPGPRGGDLLLELTRDAGGLREIAFRGVEPGPRAGRFVETVGRLDLRVPANRAAAAPLLSRRLPWPPGVVADIRAIVLRTAQAGVVERAVYEVRDGSKEVEVAARFGLELGLDVGRVRVDRRLVAASVWTGDPPVRERVDCLGGP
jgi:hypothetical protein